MMTGLYQFTVNRPDGTAWSLWDLHGRVALLVALHPTPEPTAQLVGVDRLHQTFEGAGLTVVGLPMSGTAAPGPGYGVTFPVARTLTTAGSAPDPLFAWLVAMAPDPHGSTTVPGYTKFLVGRDGAVVARFGPSADAKELIAAVQAALAAPVPAAPPPPTAPAPVAPTPAAPAPVALDRGRLPVPTPPAADRDIVEAELIEDVPADFESLQAQVDADVLAKELADNDDEGGSVGADLVGLSDELHDIEMDAQLAQEYRADPL